MPVKALVDVGSMFGFSEGALRVALARLVSTGVVERDERGWYSLSAEMAGINRWVERWRLGERRVTSWDGSWIIAWHAARSARGAARRQGRALRFLGFRRAAGEQWVRPNNLALDHADLVAMRREIEPAVASELLVARDVSPELAAAWASLWDADQLTDSYRWHCQRLERGLVSLAAHPAEQALVEAFRVGGAAIRVLALDPLLPAELIDPRPRRELTALMSQYDDIGRQAWSQLLARRLAEPTRVGAAAAAGVAR